MTYQTGNLERRSNEIDMSCELCGDDFIAYVEGAKYCCSCRGKRKGNYLHRDYKTRYDVVKRGAKLRGVSFELHIDEFREFYKLPCVYCGTCTSTVNLDRVDSKKGYSVDNVVPCCWDCNNMKGSKSVDEFIEHINNIARYFWRVKEK